MTEEEFNAKLAEIPDEDLIILAEAHVINTAAFGDKAFRMSVPPQISDADMVLCELIRRYKNKVENVK